MKYRIKQHVSADTPEDAIDHGILTLEDATKLVLKLDEEWFWWDANGYPNGMSEAVQKLEGSDFIAHHPQTEEELFYFTDDRWEPY